MIATLETPGVSAAVAGDFATQPAPQEVLRQIPTPLAQKIKALRVLTNFKESGVEVAASGTYPDDAAAQDAKKNVEQAANLAKWLALFGVTLKNVNIAVEKTDVQVKVEVDDQSLKTLLSALPQYLGG
jgi:hypothetical protein